MRVFPFAVDNTESNVFVGWSSCEVQKHSIVISGFLDDFVCRCFGFVDEIWIEYVELEEAFINGM
jgi:hypothetical protein